MGSIWKEGVLSKKWSTVRFLFYSQFSQVYVRHGVKLNSCQSQLGLKRKHLPPRKAFFVL